MRSLLDKDLVRYLSGRGLEYFLMLRRVQTFVAFLLVGSTLGLAVPAFAPEAQQVFDAVNAGGRLSHLPHTVRQIAVSFVR